jgi:hypothetical protein
MGVVKFQWSCFANSRCSGNGDRCHSGCSVTALLRWGSSVEYSAEKRKQATKASLYFDAGYYAAKRRWRFQSLLLNANKASALPYPCGIKLNL